VVRYEYRNDELIHPKNIIENIPGVFNHTGCRLKFGPDRKLYITTGDADVPKLAQDLKAYNGKILRLNEDGTIPADNPFIHNDTAKHEVWSYGHRNSQGIAFQPGTGKLYSSEHGPTGGDEINLIVKGNNYGWPVIHHRDRNDAMISPLMEFSPSIGPAEALFYSGKAFAAMKGNLLVGCMRGEAILNVQFNQNKNKILSYGFLLKNKYGRIRAMTEGPDGYLYFSTSQVDPPKSRLQAGEKSFDMILRLRPAASVEAGKEFAIKTSTGLKEAINTNFL
jgi:glucose/arabinose dehydrogenase